MDSRELKVWIKESNQFPTKNFLSVAPPEKTALSSENSTWQRNKSLQLKKTTSRNSGKRRGWNPTESKMNLTLRKMIDNWKHRTNQTLNNGILRCLKFSQSALAIFGVRKISRSIWHSSMPILLSLKALMDLTRMQKQRENRLSSVMSK